MGIEEFSSLSPAAQAGLTWDQGVFLGHRDQDGTRYVLYQLEGFYVEFHYHIADNKLTGQAAFADTAFLDPYFEQ